MDFAESGGERLERVGAGRYVTGAILKVDGGATIASPESGHADAVFAPQADPRVKGR